MDSGQKQKKLNLIPKPVQRALYAGLSAGGFSFVFGLPPEHLLRVGVAGACYSLLTSWHELGPRKRVSRSRRALLNGRPIDLEYSMSRGGYVARETWGERLSRWVYGRGEATSSVKPRSQVPRPAELDEFIFLSNGIQLRETHVKLFLRSAWRNKKYGRGLSENRWVDRFSQRPAWYQELSTDWYYAMMRLLFDAQSYFYSQQCDLWQMVLIGANQWRMLAHEPFLTMRLLKWYESERRK